MSTRKSTQKSTAESPKSAVTTTTSTVLTTDETTTTTTVTNDTTESLLSNENAENSNKTTITTNTTDPVVEEKNENSTTSTTTEKITVSEESTVNNTATHTTNTTVDTTTATDTITEDEKTTPILTAENDVAEPSDCDTDTTKAAAAAAETSEESTSNTNNAENDVKEESSQFLAVPVTTNTETENKRSRRNNSITSSPTCSQPQQTKKSDDNDETSSLGSVSASCSESIAGDLDEKKLSQNTPSSEEKVSESPLRGGRKKKVFDKSGVTTRKSAQELAITKTVVTPALNVRSMRNRRNSTGKIEIKQNEPKPKRGKKTQSSTPEPKTPIKRKREDSLKTGDEKEDQQPVDKMLKFDVDDEKDEDVESVTGCDQDMKDEKMEVEHEDELINEETNIPNDEKKDNCEEDKRTKDSQNDSVDKSGAEDPSDKSEVKDEVDVRPRRGRPRNSLKKFTPPPRQKKADKVVPVEAASPVLSESKRPIRRSRKLNITNQNDEANESNNVKNIETTDIVVTTHKAEEDEVKMCIIKGIEKPLTVDTDDEIKKNIINTEVKNEAATSSSDKAASLSPELVSEGVSVISVKQFYKKPEFLENNLGIEKDPKLGEIVQEVGKSSTKCEKTITKDEIEKISDDEIEKDNSNESNNDSLTEGALHIDDESVEDESNNKISIEINTNNSNNCETFESKKFKDSTKENNSVKLKFKICDKNKRNMNTTAVLTTEINENTITADSYDDNDLKDKTRAGKKNSSGLKNLKASHLSEIDVDSGVTDMNAIDSELDKKEDFNENDSNDSNDLRIIESDEKMEIDEKHFKSSGNKHVDGTKENESLIIDDSSNDVSENIKKVSKRLNETPETLRQKEKHLKNLGLLTHKAAVQAKIDKQRRRKFFQGTVSHNKKQLAAAVAAAANSVGGLCPGQNLNKTSNDSNSAVYSIKSGENKRKAYGNSSNSNNGNNGRHSLKITFQKGRGRGLQNDRGNHSNQSGEETYYTIQNENDSGNQSEDAVSHGRKSLNRYHTEINNHSEPASVDASKKDGKEKILIPEKASSFGIHPGRLCQDQCYYCGGKFGLYDTPCHVAQLKSVERQQKILANEEKITVDNCLCDACFRHIDKRANVPSYKKRNAGPTLMDHNDINSSSMQQDNENNSDDQQSYDNRTICFLPDCNNIAAHSLRKKCVRKTIKKILPNFDISTIGSSTPICSEHHDSILQYLGCALCKRRLGKNHMYHIQESEKLEILLSSNNVPVQIGNSSAICKLCRYFTNLLMKPSTGSKQNDFVRSYRRRLLQFHNVQTDDEASDEADDEKTKSKRSRKSKKHILLDDKQSDSNSPSSVVALDEIPTNGSATTSGHMLLDNDVLVNYDMPPLSESPSPSPPPLLASKLKSILQGSSSESKSSNKKEDISLVLRSNPNISMRELFPGEEEMGVQVNLPFGSSLSHRTPEGWTRVQTFLQYDEPTRRLWEELQKPYGNQSSFLRHLILLEKYYRNGDLILSHNASSNATVYSETVQNRLRSYDNHNINHIASALSSSSSSSSINTKNHNDQERRNSKGQSEDNLKQINCNNYPVTITTRPKQQQNMNNSSSTNNIVGNSIKSTKSNTKSTSNSVENSVTTNLVSSKNAIEILPIASNKNVEVTKQQKLLDAANKLIGNDRNSPETQVSPKSQSVNKSISEQKKTDLNNSTTPPELISINRPIMPASSKQRDQQQQQQQLQQQHQRIQNYQKQMQMQNKINKHQGLIVLTDTLTPMERVSSKNWRPTLMPVTSAAHLNQTGPLYQTADGRRLPALVQVQSGGRPYLISIHDYNRMCILRREKLLREQMLKNGSKYKHMRAGIVQPSLTPSKNKLQIPNKILEQNSLTVVNQQQQNRTPNSMATEQQRQRAKQLRQQQQQQAQQISLLKSSSNFVPILPKLPQNHQLQILPANNNNNNTSNSSNSNCSTSNINNSTPLSIATSMVHNSVSIVPTIPNVLPLATTVSTVSTGSTLVAPNSATGKKSWSWNNNNNTTTSTGNNCNSNLNNYLSSALNSAGISMNAILGSKYQQQQQQQQNQQLQQLLTQQFQKANANNNNMNTNSNNNSGPMFYRTVTLDSNVLSKIPKSLTVIPQQKTQITNQQQQPQPGRNSAEDLTSA